MLLRKVMLSVVMLFLITLIGLGQADPREQLKGLLLNEEELKETLEGDWVLDLIDRLDPEPPGAVTLFARFIEGKSDHELIDGLLDFSTAGREAADRFIKEIQNVKQILEVIDLKGEPDRLADLKAELLLDEKTDVALLLRLEDGRHQVTFQRGGTLIGFIRTFADEIGEDGIIRVSQRQLEKIVNFCESAESKPAYC